MILQPVFGCRAGRAVHISEEIGSPGTAWVWCVLRPLTDLSPWSRARLLVLLLAFLAVGCTSSDAPRRHIIDSPLVPFDELFALEDTVRLDPSIVVGMIMFLDVNQEGHLLVSDMITKSVYRFSASGEYMRAYSVPKCLPDVAEFVPWSSRFIDGDRIMAMTMGGPVVVFDAAGNCVAASRRLPDSFTAFCAKDDSIHVLTMVGPPQRSDVVVYSTALERLGKTRVEKPEFRQLNLGRHGYAGRTFECFDDGPYYTYLGSEDAKPVRTYAEIAQAHPPFFVKRQQDLRRNLTPMEAQAEIRAYPTNYGVFRIDSLTRMVVYSNLRDKWHSDTQRFVGLGVVSNVSRFPARSTLSTVIPKAAGYGYFHSVGDNESLPDGEVGNPVIVRYKFIQPTDADE